MLRLGWDKSRKLSALIAGLSSILTTKGDLLGRKTGDVERLPVGSDGQVLMADSSDDFGIAWTSLDGLTTVTVDIDFTASASEDVTIAIGAAVKEVVRGRLYIDADPGAQFSHWATLTFYNKSAKHGADAFWRTVYKIVYDELEVATDGTGTTITPDDHTLFSPNDLLWIIDGASSEFIRIKTVANAMTAEDTIGSHDIDDGISRVLEFSSFPVWNNESGTNVYARLAFASSQTVSLKLELVLRI